MRKFIFGLLSVTTLIVVLPFMSYSASIVDETIKLYVGSPQIVAVNSPTRVAVGNPLVADVGSISKDQLMIEPKAAGTTTLIVWDNFGEQSYQLTVFAENTAEIKRRIDNIFLSLNLPDVYTKAEDEEARVVLLGNVKSAKDKERISVALAGLKAKTVDLIVVKEEEAVIEMDVQIIELSRGSYKSLGLEWPTGMDLLEVGSKALTPPGVSSIGKLFTIAGGTRDAFELKLNFLEHEGKARVLSRPRISCQSGKEAKLVVGGEVPIISSTPASGGSAATSNVEYKEYGIVLNVKPQLTDNNRIHVNLDISVSELGTPVDTVDNTYAVPLTKRSATTELFLNDGQTMGIGGLIKKKNNEDLKKVPWLADVPVLGVFFRNRNTGSGATADGSIGEDVELFITLTPKIVTTVKPQESTLKSVAKNIPSIADDKITDPVLKYSKLVQMKILNNLTYPAAAKEAGFQGAVKLSLKLSAQGDLLEAKIKEPSSYRVLDDAALTTASQTTPYPPFPPEIKEKETWVEIPIIFQLE